MRRRRYPAYRLDEFRALAQPTWSTSGHQTHKQGRGAGRYPACGLDPPVRFKGTACWPRPSPCSTGAIRRAAASQEIGQTSQICSVRSKEASISFAKPIVSQPSDILGYARVSTCGKDTAAQHDRLGRSLAALQETVEDLRSRGIHFARLKERIDTSSKAARQLGIGRSIANRFVRLSSSRTSSGKRRVLAVKMLFPDVAMEIPDGRRMTE